MSVAVKQVARKKDLIQQVNLLEDEIPILKKGKNSRKKIIDAFEGKGINVDFIAEFFSKEINRLETLCHHKDPFIILKASEEYRKVLELIFLIRGDIDIDEITSLDVDFLQSKLAQLNEFKKLVHERAKNAPPIEEAWKILNKVDVSLTQMLIEERGNRREKW